VPALFPSLLPMDPTRVRRDARILAVEHLHLPHEAAGVDRSADGPLAVEQLHLPHMAAGVDKTRLKRALAMAVTFIL
jgi:hypothetical protein